MKKIFLISVLIVVSSTFFAQKIEFSVATGPSINFFSPSLFTKVYDKKPLTPYYSSEEFLYKINSTIKTGGNITGHILIKSSNLLNIKSGIGFVYTNCKLDAKMYNISNFIPEYYTLSDTTSAVITYLGSAEKVNVL